MTAASENARDVARRVLRRVDEGAYATLALAGELERARSRPPIAGLATELTYGVLKQQRRASITRSPRYAPRGIDKLDARVLDALRIGAYQILFLRVPAHAAVDDAVEAIKKLRSQKLANFANGLLRALARGGEPATIVARRARLGARLARRRRAGALRRRGGRALPAGAQRARRRCGCGPTRCARRATRRCAPSRPSGRTRR